MDSELDICMTPVDASMLTALEGEETNGAWIVHDPETGEVQQSKGC